MNDLVALVLLPCAACGFEVPAGSARSDAPRCANLPKTCGPTGDDDCCSTATTIPGGTFYRGHDVAPDGAYAITTHPATVSAFQIDAYEVTVGRFRAFVTAGQGTRSHPPAGGTGGHERIPSSGWDPRWNDDLPIDDAALRASLACDPAHQTWIDDPGLDEDLAINCVSWYEAMAFCIWDGGYLPTEAEWNFVAVGGDDQRAYPWSSPPSSTTIDCSRANYDRGPYCADPPVGAVARVGDEMPEGAGRWGHADLAGNVFEWTVDAYGPYVDPCDDCANLAPAPSRVLRGGGWDNLATDVRANYRLDRQPDLRHRAVGIRCARPTK